MTTTDTRDTFIRLLREDSDFRRTVRREILTSELLEMPQKLDALAATVAALADTTADLVRHAEATNRRLDRLEEGRAESDRRLGRIEADMGEMKQDIVEVKSEMGEMRQEVRQVSRDIDGLGDKFDEEVRAQGAFRGTYAQYTANADRVQISNLFAHLHGVKRTDAMPLRRSALKAWLRENADAVEALNLRERAWETFLQPDIVAAARDLMADDDSEPLYYIAVEASYTIDKEDIDRATDHAKIVRAITGLNAYAVVAGARLYDDTDAETRGRMHRDAHRYADADDPDAVYWHTFDSADLRPREPR